MVETESGPTFFALCYRVSAYPGVMMARHAADLEAESPVVGGVSALEPVREIESTPGAVARAGMADLFEWGASGA